MIKELKDQTSEEIHKISKQPEPTCPLIDKVISIADKALFELKGFEKDQRNEDSEALANRCDYAEWHINDIDDAAERVRSHVESIRNWGEEWKQFALKLIEERGCQPNTLDELARQEGH